MRGKRASGTKHARIRETIYRIFEDGNAGLWTVEHISPDLLRDFSKELSALFASVNSLSPIIENGLLFGSLRKWRL